jgi:hypothetical protein
MLDYRRWLQLANMWVAHKVSLMSRTHTEAYSHYPKVNYVKQQIQLLIELSCRIVLCSMTYLYNTLL